MLISRMIRTRWADAFHTLDPLDVRKAVADLTRPSTLMSEIPSATRELIRIFLGVSNVQVSATDERFADAAWRTNPLYRRIGQSHVVRQRLMSRLVAQAGERGGPGCEERARLLADIITGATAPVNFLAGNPEAVKRMLDTGGLSVLRGAQNMLHDLTANGRLPRNVDSTPFQVGENLACTPGAVVYREDMFELIQYTPSTSTVRQRPMVMFPPQINRYYLLDLAPGRSLTEYLVSKGIQTFMVVWRNPRPEDGAWTLDDYVAAGLRALEVARSITGVSDVNTFGLCSGGVTNAVLLGYLAAVGDDVVHSATQAMTMLDGRAPSPVGALVTSRLLDLVARDAASGTVYDSAITKVFSWLRPTELIYNYAVSGWLLGDDPPAFDLLAWNTDTVRVSSAFLRDALDIMTTDKTTTPGAITVLGVPIDLLQIGVDTFHISGSRDHICPWRSCYLATQAFGGERTVVVGHRGHIGTVVSPPDGADSYLYRVGLAGARDPDSWLREAATHTGSWWPEWAEWLLARSGGERQAPAELGSADHPAGDPAPGRYVRES